ncbi:monocarboxylate transporter 7-like [Lytechinus variegatus]|uniref:monocarboxylate transporter 7-like n=1 Tax=Lytechinus variegatus TaxID=7654 RepID=UPI001BB215EC|nr:monocarboxylate transporter 7-like [Lytechinus variegatus]
MTMFLIIGSRRLRKKQNIFICNIALVDCVASALPFVYWLMLYIGVRPDYNVILIMRASLIIETGSTLSVALFRLITLRFDPFNKRNLVTAPRCILACIFIWIIPIGAFFIIAKLDMDYSTAGSLVTLQSAIYYIACPFSYYLAHKFGGRRITTIGGFLSAMSLLAGSFSQSAVFLGCSFFFTGLFASPLRQLSSETLHQHYGEHGYGFAQTITMLGCQVGSFLMPYIIVLTLDAYGMRGSLLFLSAMLFHGVPIAATLRPPRRPQGPCETNSSIRRNGDGPELEPLHTGDEVGSSASMEEIILELGDVNTDKGPEKQENPSLQHSIVDGIRILVMDTIDFVKKERTLIFLLLPCQVLFDTTFVGWEVFLFSYGITEGLSKDQAVYTVMMGSVGGVVGRLTLLAILYKFPLLSLQLLASNLALSSIMLLVYPINSSLTYLTICSFIAGFGFFNAYTSFFGTVAIVVQQENFPKAIACSLMLSGICYLISGIIAGSLYNLFGTYRAVFRVLGIMSGASSSAFTTYIFVNSSRRKQK